MKKLLLFIAVLCPLLLVGCGGDDGDSSGNTAGGPSTWAGTITNPGYPTYSMILQIDEKNGSAISGTISYGLYNMKTRFSGSISGSHVQFTEYEVIQGPAGVPCYYTATLNGNTMSGTLRYMGEDAGTFQLSRQ